MGDRVILITGASRGIGFECAKRLLVRSDATVMITGRDPGGLAAARASLPIEHRDRLEVMVSDQDDRAQVESLASWLSDPAVPLGGVILGVGVNPRFIAGPQRLGSLPAATVEATIRTNCTHAMLLSIAALSRFGRERHGVLLWIGSQAFRVGLPGAGLYCATKAFLSGLAATARREYRDRGVRTYLFNPGLVRTPRTTAVIDRFAARHGAPVVDATSVADQIVTRFLSGPPDEGEVDL